MGLFNKREKEFLVKNNVIDKNSDDYSILKYCCNKKLELLEKNDNYTEEVVREIETITSIENKIIKRRESI